MNRSLFLFVAAYTLLGLQQTNAQRYTSEKSTVGFFSKAAIEDIKASNTQSAGIVDLSTNGFAFSIPITGFEFEKNLMKEHFNEKYLETEKYPKATFQGKMSGFDPTKKGVQNIKAAGKLLIHGVANEVELPATIELSTENKLIVNATFIVKLEDYKIKIPKLMWQNIAEQVDVKVDFTMIQK
jgi:polyisoprenoid-binding protein YceI